MFSVCDYTFSEIISQGKIATIYKASKHSINDDSDSLFAIKRVELKYIQYCILETNFIKELSHYPLKFNEIIEVFKTPNNAYLVYRYYDQGTFEDILTMKKDLDISEIIEYIRQIISAFIVLNGHGIIHRDLRPSNIVINGKQTKITGFYSAIKENEGEKYPLILASPLYMSPEFIKGNIY